MMSQDVRIEFDSSAPATLEAMFVLGQAALRPHAVVHMILSIATMILISAGGAAVLFAVGVLLTGQPEPALHYIWIGAFGAAAFFLFAQRWPPGRLARVMTSSTYGRGRQWAHFSETAVTFGNAHAEWRTDWAAIDNIRLGKKGIILQVAAIGFVIPRSGVEDAEALVRKLEAWKDVA